MEEVEACSCTREVHEANYMEGGNTKAHAAREKKMHSIKYIESPSRVFGCTC
jgi:hypothetical protein